MPMLAIQDYRNALHIDHTNKECIMGFEKLLKKVEDELVADSSSANSELLTDILFPFSHFLCYLLANQNIFAVGYF